MNITTQQNSQNGSVVLKPKKRSRQASYGIGDYDDDKMSGEFSSLASEDSWLFSNRSSLSESTQSSMSSFSQSSQVFTERSKNKRYSLTSNILFHLFIVHFSQKQRQCG